MLFLAVTRPRRRLRRLEKRYRGPLSYPDDEDGGGAAETFPESQASSAYVGEASVSYSKEVDHV